jgi:hypothetical protein
VPAYNDIASLYCESGQWVIHYAIPADQGHKHAVTEPDGMPVTEETFIRVLNSIAADGA